MGLKQKYCKCGHEKTFHKGKSKLSFATFCRQCQCSSYMNRKLPDKFSYAFMCFAIVLGMSFMVLSYVVLTESDPALTGNENITVSFTLGELHEIMTLLFILINVFFISWFVIDPIMDVIRAKKRPSFPLSDKVE